MGDLLTLTLLLLVYYFHSITPQRYTVNFFTQNLPKEQSTITLIL